MSQQLRQRPPATVARLSDEDEQAVRLLKTKNTQWQAALKALDEAKTQGREHVKVQVRGRECWAQSADTEAFCRQQIDLIEAQLRKLQQPVGSP